MDKAVKTFFAQSDKVNINTNMALRFLRVRKEPDEQMKEILNSCVDEVKNEANFKASYRYFDIKIDGDTVFFDDCMKVESKNLCKNLSGCKGAFVFVATSSLSIDRLIHKYKQTQVSRALVIDAVSSAAIEGFCNYMCENLQEEYDVGFRPRFSPGYGDLHISFQEQVIKICDATRQVGVTLNKNYMMIPTKSVSAIAGVRPQNEKCDKSTDCENCDHPECPYRE